MGGEGSEMNANKIFDFHNVVNCQYYSNDEFNAKFNDVKNKGLSFLHLNIASLSKHFDNLACSLNEIKVKFKVIAITETRLVKGFSSNQRLDLPGYTFLSNDTESSAGGTALYISDTLKTKVRSDFSTITYVPKNLESTFMEILNNGRDGNVIVGCIYKHPSFSNSDFVSNVSQILDKVNKEGKRLILLGDFNINLLEYDHDHAVKEFIDTFHSYFVFPTISLPTRITPNTKTLIDNIFVSRTFKSKCVTGNLTVGISDHLPQFLLFQNNNININPNEEKFYKNWKAFRIEEFKTHFQSIDWKTIMQVEVNDPNVAFTNFYENLNHLISQYLPIKKLTKKQTKRKEKPWISQGILRSIKVRDKIYSRFLKEKDPIVKKILHERYKTYRNRLVNLIRLSKRNYFQKYFSDNEKTPKNIWKGINEIIALKNKKNFKNTSLEIDGTIVSNPEILSNKFNTYYTSEPAKIAKNIHPTNVSYKDFLKRSNQKSFFFIPVNSIEIKEIISQLNFNKSDGPNSIPNQILKVMINEISDILATIFNISFETGKFIDFLKVARVIPIYKNKGSPLEPGNYRPISLISNIDKIFEKIVYKRMLKFLDDNKYIFKRQFGFRSKHSTKHSLITITESIRKSLDNGNLSCGVFLDFQKAFDTVNHDILLNKLKHYGFRGISHEWLKSYLTGRKQFVSCNGGESSLLEIKLGVPQGSVLGPLLFLIYINDISNCLIYSKAFIFADDTALLYSLKTQRKFKNT